MTELPPPDLRDTSGRLRRLAFALLLGTATATLAWLVANMFFDPAAVVGHTLQGVVYAYRPMFVASGMAGVFVFTIALVIQNKLANKRYREGLVAKAQLVRR